MSHAHSTHLQQSKIAFRDSHIVIRAIAALAALYLSFKQWRGRRRTHKALAGLDDHQLRDIGLTRGDATPWRRLSSQAQQRCQCSLAALDDSELIHLSDFGRRARGQAQHGRKAS